MKISYLRILKRRAIYFPSEQRPRVDSGSRSNRGGDEQSPASLCDVKCFGDEPSPPRLLNLPWSRLHGAPLARNRAPYRWSSSRMLLSAALIFAGATQSLFADDGQTNKESRFLDHTRQLTYEGRRSGEGYFSGDNKKIVFQSERELANPFYQIYVLDLESGETQRLSPGTGKTTCAFFRPGSDERTIRFHAWRSGVNRQTKS